MNMGQALSDRVAGQFLQNIFCTVWLLIRAFEEAYVFLIRLVFKKLHCSGRISGRFRCRARGGAGRRSSRMKSWNNRGNRSTLDITPVSQVAHTGTIHLKKWSNNKLHISCFKCNNEYAIMENKRLNFISS